MDTYLLTHLVVLAALVLATMYFSAAETGLLSLPMALLQKRMDQPGLAGKAFREWHDHPNRILTTILLGNNAVNVAVTTLAAYMAVHFADLNGWNRTVTGTLASVMVMLALIVFGEAIPKVTARIYTAAVTPWLVVPIYLMDRWMAPLNGFLSRIVSRFFPGLAKAGVALVTEDDVKHLIEMGEKAGTIEEEETKMIHSIFKFTDTKVGAVMIPRTEMFCVDIKMPFEGLLDLMVENGYSRVPVYRESPDHIVGIVHTRDLLSIWKNRDLIVLQDLLRKPYFVPESMRVDRLLREFRRGRFHMAIVVDEYGGTAGLVTMEDLVEEIIGEIRDEREADEDKALARQADGSWIIEADMALDEVNEALGTRLAPKGEVASLGGYVLEVAGRVPKKGRVIEDKEAVFKILEADETGVTKVKVVKRKTPLIPPPAEGGSVIPKTRKKKPRGSSAPVPAETLVKGTVEETEGRSPLPEEEGGLGGKSS